MRQLIRYVFAICVEWSQAEITMKLVATKFTLGPEIAADSWHDDLIRGQLNRSLGTIYPNIHDEIVTTLEQHVGETRSGKSVPFMPCSQSHWRTRLG